MAPIADGISGGIHRDGTIGKMVVRLSPVHTCAVSLESAVTYAVTLLIGHRIVIGASCVADTVVDTKMQVRAEVRVGCEPQTSTAEECEEATRVTHILTHLAPTASEHALVATINAE